MSWYYWVQTSQTGHLPDYSHTPSYGDYSLYNGTISPIASRSNNQESFPWKKLIFLNADVSVIKYSQPIYKFPSRVNYLTLKKHSDWTLQVMRQFSPIRVHLCWFFYLRLHAEALLTHLSCRYSDPQFELLGTVGSAFASNTRGTGSNPIFYLLQIV